MTLQYVMRATLTIGPGGLVYWAVLGSPDYTGEQSGYNPSDLTGIVIDYSFQVPINGEGGITPTGLVGGDLGGTLPNPVVVQIQDKPVSVTAPTTGQALVYNGTSYVPAIPGTTFNVKNYGAVGNNVIDDTAAITSCLAAAAVNGGTVFFPAATYKVSSITIPNNLTIYGEGQAQSVINFYNNNYSINTGAGVSLGSHIRMRSLGFQGSAKFAIQLPNSIDVVLEDLYVTGANIPVGGDDYVAGIGLGTVNGSGVSQITIRGCSIINNGQGGSEDASIFGYYYVGTSFNEQVSLINNYIVNGNAPYCVEIYNAQDCLIDGNYINQNNYLGGSDNSGYGLVFYDAATHISTNRIINNKIINCAGNGIYYQSGPYETGTYDPVSPTPQGIIANNIIQNVGTQETDTNLLVSGISCNANFIIISNNQILQGGPQCSGISVQGNGASVTGNSITGIPARPAINVRAVGVGLGLTDFHASARTLVANNNITDCLFTGISATSSTALDMLNISNNVLGWNYTSFIVNTSTYVLTVYATTFANGQTVRVRNVGGTLATGLSPFNVYQIINWNATDPGAATFQLSSDGIHPVAITNAGSGTNELCTSPAAGAGGTAINLDGYITNSVISGNIAEGFQTGGLLVYAASGCMNNIISNNNIRNCSLRASGSYAGIYNIGINTIITGNYAGDGYQGGLFDYGTYSSITGNNFTNGTQSFWDPTSVVVGTKFYPSFPDDYLISPRFIVASGSVLFSNNLVDNGTFQITPGNGSQPVIVETSGQQLTIDTAGGGTTFNDSVSFDGYVTIGQLSTQANLYIVSSTQTTVGTEGGASNIPTAPALYLKVWINGTEYVIPAFPKS